MRGIIESTLVILVHVCSGQKSKSPEKSYRETSDASILLLGERPIFQDAFGVQVVS